MAGEALLPPARREQIFESWIRRYPEDSQLYGLYLAWLLKQKDRQASGALAARIKATFPDDAPLIVITDVTLARIEGGPDASLDIYASRFSPLWPESLRAQYLQALSSAHQLRSFVARSQPKRQAIRRRSIRCFESIFTTSSKIAAILPITSSVNS